MKPELKSILTLFILILSVNNILSQTRDIDSLLVLVSKQKDDTMKIKSLNALSWRLMGVKQFEKAKSYALEMIALSRKFNFYKGFGGGYNILYQIETRQGNLDESIRITSEALEHYKADKSLKFQALAYGSLGNAYYRKGLYPKALENYIAAIKLYEELGNKMEAAGYSGNVGAIYERQNKPQKALEFYKNALKTNEELKYKQGIAINYVCIANVYHNCDISDSIALEYALKALEINKQLNDKGFLGNNYEIVGVVYEALKQPGKAIEYFLLAKNIFEEQKNKNTIAANYANISNVYIKLNKLDEALNYLNKALELSKTVNSLALDRVVNDIFSRYYTATGDYKKSFEYYKKYTANKDSILNDKNRESIVEQQLMFEFEKKEALSKSEFEKLQAIKQAKLDKQQSTLALLEKDNQLKELSLNQSALALKQKQVESEAQKRQVELLNKDVQLKEAESKQKNQELQRERLVRNATIAGAFLFLLLLFVVFRSLKQSKQANKIIAQQKEEVVTQKHLVEEKNKEITDSINYARRLQDAILPPLDFMNAYLKKCFVYYKPKDIVAGDFYWMEAINSDTVLIAAADSTGHGVPGAMVSVVCSNALNRAVKEFKLTKPADILNKTRELVLETFEKSDKDVKDGMDISLASLSLSSLQLQWAGANNPLWYINHNELKEITANKQPIGKVDNPVPFTNHTMQLSAGDMIYLITDGYADQFGGEKGKKFKYKQLKEVLMSIHTQEPLQQQNILDKTFNNWKGLLEQVDDVTIIGIKI